jgi:hypothetical protein
MPSSWMRRCVALVRPDDSEELSASIIMMIRNRNISITYQMTHAAKKYLLLVRADVVPSSSINVTLMMEALGSSETSVLTRAKRRNIPEYGILHSHRHENIRSYIALTGWTL